MSLTPLLLEPSSREPADVDFVELYFERGWTDGLPVVPPTQDKVNAVVQALGGDAGFVECKVAPRCRFDALSRGRRYGKVYNRNLPKWYKREPDSRIPIVESPD